MKISDLEYTVREIIPEVMDEHMRKYIDQCLSQGAFLIHNTKKDAPYYTTVLHERDMPHFDTQIQPLGDLMAAKFGHDFRSTSVYSTFHGESQYGNPYILLPYGGEYEICYSPVVPDMYHVYNELVVKTYEDMYELLKNGFESEMFSNVAILDIWNSFEHTIQSMHTTYEDYHRDLIVHGLNTDQASVLVLKFKSIMQHYYERVAKTYKVSSDINSVYADVGKEQNPSIELMVKAPKYLMVSSRYIGRKFGKNAVEFFKGF